jgi:PKD repeat protein
MVTACVKADHLAAYSLFLACLFIMAVAHPVSCQYQEHVSEISLQLPMYDVASEGGFDRVSIPGGSTLNEIGKPMVPIFVYTTSLPVGQRVQSLSILEQGGFTNATGLILPIFEANVTGGGTIPNLGGESTGWYPELELAWETWDYANGSSALAITIYPFKYNANTTESSYCSIYTIGVTYVTTSAVMAGISSDKSAYDPGETVVLEVGLENAGGSENLILGITILQSGSLEVIDALPLMTLHEFQGAASIQMNWTETDVAPGEYIALAELNDTEGHRLSTASLSIPIGIPKVEITSFGAAPQHFEIGDEVVVEVTARNTGSVDASGACFVIVRNNEMIVQATEINFTGVKPNHQRAFQAAWDTSNATEDTIYTVLAYVSYNGMTTSAESCIISTNQMPVLAVSHSPALPWTGLNVTFDTSGSYDPDGEIAAFVWNFGDYSSSNGSSVTHSYKYAGNYTVTLTVVDDKGAEGHACATIEIAQGYYLNATSNIGVAVQGSGLYKEGTTVQATAPADAPVQGIMGSLGSRYVFKQWTGATNSTDSTVSVTVGYETSHYGLVAVYQEQGSNAMFAILAVVIMAALVVAFLLFRSHGRGKQGA